MALPPLSGFLFPPPASLFVTAMSVITSVSQGLVGLSEVAGRHAQYSKFWNANLSESRAAVKLSGRAGMLLLYTPALLVAAAASFAVPSDRRTRLLVAVLTTHFLKRDLEVLFVHSYSGHMILEAAIPISLNYFLNTLTAIYAQYLSQNMPEPAVNITLPGVIMFLVGISGNFYHHYLLAKLRSKDDRGYKIPRGGLFELVICPHYLFEIISFVGVSFISQTVFAFSFPIGSSLYLMGRSYATRKWYLSKFEDFPRNVKALIPYVF